MSNTIRFECTRLGNRLGRLKSDGQGGYVMPVGGLNVFNSAGQYYTFEAAKKLFEESSQFMRRVERAVVRASNTNSKYSSPDTFTILIALGVIRSIAFTLDTA